MQITVVGYDRLERNNISIGYAGRIQNSKSQVQQLESMFHGNIFGKIWTIPYIHHSIFGPFGHTQYIQIWIPTFDILSGSKTTL